MPTIKLKSLVGNGDPSRQESTSLSIELTHLKPLTEEKLCMGDEVLPDMCSYTKADNTNCSSDDSANDDTGEGVLTRLPAVLTMIM